MDYCRGKSCLSSAMNPTITPDYCDIKCMSVPHFKASCLCLSQCIVLLSLVINSWLPIHFKKVGWSSLANREGSAGKPTLYLCTMIMQIHDQNAANTVIIMSGQRKFWLYLKKKEKGFIMQLMNGINACLLSLVCAQIYLEKKTAI